MPPKKDNLLQEAEEAIDAVFGDTSVSQDETISRLEELHSNIEFKLESLQDH